MKPYRRFVNNTVTISLLSVFVATLAVQPQVQAGEAPPRAALGSTAGAATLS